MAAVCEGLLAKLNELMDFLRFAKLPDAEFRGVVTFMFRASPNDKNNIACMRTIDMRRGGSIFTKKSIFSKRKILNKFCANLGLEVDNTTLHPQDPFLPEVAVVYVSLADFLYMYSGEATATEIAGMVMSGRVSVPWSSYGKLKAFAECFDFSTEKWDAYYADLKARGVVAKIPECTQACCKQSTKEDIEANWLLVSDATTTSGGDWEVVSDLQCLNVSKEKREEMDKVFDFTPLEEWLAKLWNGDGARSADERPARSLQSNVKNSLSDLKSMAGRLFVSLEA
ncbi:hypothetical protein, variant 2 [Phytophthora nicotianae INRA-310]|uniref:Uncharacterized protein n=1 Tax=Phytophthora nicotianae (strain INRA-310) TaxID=761204 RepID=W2Q0V0_PHYN3|nr:hypothetical protein, variant 2 [Phytophthora nicotianae INRA-310]ETN06803.1 hypothetical protein, variant 2 [Phytophthora nicotianae INRA-310]